ncbi:MAG: hypothetical protein EOP53_22885 [Sphingobacteriales bacterium]|nr:MAG: hypothetical protein EOP53_22885 [Sphingobacteriales bacterium]
MKISHRFSSVLPAFILALAGLASCASEDELVPAFAPDGSPYLFRAYFLNHQNDTTARYKIELHVTGEKSNVEGSEGNYSISFNTSDKTYNTRWQITSLGLPPDTITYEGNINKDGSSFTIEMPQSGIFAPLQHTVDLSASVKDEAGNVSKTIFSRTRQGEEGLQQITTEQVLKKIEHMQWNGQQIQTWNYEAVNQHDDILTKVKYSFSPQHGILRAEYALPGNEKIIMLQVPKSGVAKHK